MFFILKEPLEPRLEEIDLRSSSRGAVLTFEGRVRDENQGKRVVRLDYEAYEELACREAERIFEEASRRYPVSKLVGLHREGELTPGQLAFWVGVSAPHRGPAFEACRYSVDEIKRRVPIWKKEHYEDGTSKHINFSADD